MYFTINHEVISSPAIMSHHQIYCCDICDRTRQVFFPLWKDDDELYGGNDDMEMMMI